MESFVQFVYTKSCNVFFLLFNKLTSISSVIDHEFCHNIVKVHVAVDRR